MQEHSLLIGNQKIIAANKVKLLGIDIDNKLSFDEHISKLSKKTSNQLHAISILQFYLGFEEKVVLVQVFFTRISIIVPKSSILLLQESNRKLKNCKKEP